MSIDVSPLNDLALTIKLKDVDPTTAALIPRTTGSVTAFFANDDDPATAAADPSLSVSATFVGGDKWLAAWDASALTTALLDALFTHPAPVIVLQLASGFRVYLALNYVRSRPAEET